MSLQASDLAQDHAGRVMIAHPALTDDTVMLGSRSSSGGPRVGALTAPAVLIDEALAAYIDWRAVERGVADAYARWYAAAGAEENVLFGAYTAALDQEETAAKAYAESIGRLTRWIRRHGAPAANHQQGTTTPHPDPDES